MLKDHQIHTINSYAKSAVQYANKIAKLTNYNHTYDFVINNLKKNDMVLDLACGPGNISKYLKEQVDIKITGYDLADEMLYLAKENVPDGVFEKKSIIDFKSENKFDLIVNGFGLPYLDNVQRQCSFKCCYNSLKDNGIFYLSFMNGDKEGFEKVSYNPDEEFYLHYHLDTEVENDLQNVGFSVIKKWVLDYQESDGSITKDIILILQKLPNRR